MSIPGGLSDELDKTIYGKFKLIDFEYVVSCVYTHETTFILPIGSINPL